MHLLGDVGQAMGSSPDTTVISMIDIAVYKALARSFQSSSLYLDVQEVVDICVADLQSVDAVMTSMIDS